MVKIVRFFCLVLYIADTHAVSYQYIKEMSLCLAAVATIVPPLEIAYLNASQFRRSFITEIQDPSYIMGGLALGGVVGAVFYYVGKQFTPQSRYEWALEIKNSLESNELLNIFELDQTKMKELLLARFGRSFPFMSLIDFFYYKHCILQKALEVLCTVILELESDVVFRQQCEDLLHEINCLNLKICQRAVSVVCTCPEWYHELNPYKTGSFFITKDSKESIKWVVELAGGHVWWPFITFGPNVQIS